ncbi:MAG TPA: FUSC family protein [Candidatus Acidoferrum sp.]|nr:FUSC family protein [Candidatus Acidoferrum sp.]
MGSRTFGRTRPLSSARAFSRRLHVAVKPPRDPGLSGLRRAARAATIIPLAFAFADVLLRAPQSLVFVMFGCFSLLVISDFGGFRRPRALAYLTATLVGAALVALGTLVSTSPWLPAVLMFVVAFTISFSRIFGGYFAAANLGMLLAFVIAVTIPAPPDVIPARVGGWAMAGLISTGAAIALWPRFERVMTDKLAAKALLAVADLVEGMRPGAGNVEFMHLQEAARAAVQEARQAYAVMGKRPIAPARRDRAFIQMLIECERIVDIIERPFNEDRSAVRPDLPEGKQLLASVVDALRSSAAVLNGGAKPHLQAIEATRVQHRAALDRWAAEQLGFGRPVEEVLDGLDVDDTLRVVSYVTFTLGRHAIIAAGAKLDAGDAAIDVLQAIRTHLEPPSTVLQGTLRVAIGLALAVFIAGAFGLSHAFWVVLGTIQVLRSNALGTGRTIVLAVAGNAIGVLIGGAFAVLAGNDRNVMWIAFPIAVFLAAYAATTIGFMLSQAAFTINLIIVFNLISPAGWQVGLVRIEDLMVGAVISLVVGLLLWPHGARRELARALGSVYRDLVEYMGTGFDLVLGFVPAAAGFNTASAADPLRKAVLRARDRADAAFDTFITEKGDRSFDQETAAFLLASANHAILAGDLLEVIAGLGYQAGTCADGAREVHEQVRVLLSRYRRLADRLDLSPALQPETRVVLSALRQAELGCLRRWQKDPEVGKGAVAVVMAGEWVSNLTRLENDLETPVTGAVEAAQKPWWR